MNMITLGGKMSSKIKKLASFLAVLAAMAVYSGAYAQMTSGFISQTTDVSDSQLLADVEAELPTGVSLDNATAAQIQTAVNTVVESAGTGANITSQILGVVSVALDNRGRSAIANNVTTNVVNAQPPAVQGQITASVSQSRANPTASQSTASANSQAGTLPPSRTNAATTPVATLTAGPSTQPNLPARPQAAGVQQTFGVQTTLRPNSGAGGAPATLGTTAIVTGTPVINTPAIPQPLNQPIVSIEPVIPIVVSHPI